jgi:hypothetical protein
MSRILWTHTLPLPPTGRTTQKGTVAKRLTELTRHNKKSLVRRDSC